MPGASSDTIPLCVDLDGTLIRTDMLIETLVLFLKRKPWGVALLPFWALQGRAVVKHRLAERVQFDAARLPYRTEFLDFLRAERASGRSLVLATAADRLVAEKIASHLGLFDEVIASDPGSNRKGRAKLAALQQRFPQGFDYAGDSAADLPIWKCARRSLLVGAAPHLLQAVGEGPHLERVFSAPRTALFARVRSALRIPR
jgi:phosphoserine phosphatase